MTEPPQPAPSLAFRCEPLETAIYSMERWYELADTAIEPNMFMEPAFVATAAGRIEPAEWLIASVGREDDPLSGLLVVRERSGLPGYLPPWLDGFSSAYGPLGTPLLRQPHDGAALVEGLATLAPLLRLRDVNLDGPVARGLLDTLKARNCHVVTIGEHARAELDAGATPDKALGNDLKGRRRHDLNRRLQRLEETGPVTWKLATSETDVDHALGAFLRLEAGGWRKRSGLAAHFKRLDFAQRFLPEQARRGRVRCDVLLHRGTQVGVLISLIAGRQAAIWKVAHDADAAFASPGAQVLAHATEAFLASPDIDRVDSLAVEGHPLIERQWAGRKRMGTLIAALDPDANDLVDRLADVISRINNMRTSLRNLLRRS
ncbi:GNAT family N-acetyltransferase [Oryzibacter oryziterrae]|uniref:GNAT family N-acetyltransferase n=1 Tax=Oryzibacter oryziterrae TaxID=2766474 RepID=UPI001F430B16|nr:GNAT family N-acetyltransferase [Oryzibacter oryziterrae]